ncbi:glutamate receptor ionotropic, kainate 4 isoform X2 [Procambarus clarkii]|uniref:glutamate receptor ionotropic, kainate 4 isoform X2 n=1 Tax=Procambarus clarkii TaxID=6728 RepID=UPI003743D805
MSEVCEGRGGALLQCLVVVIPALSSQSFSSPHTMDRRSTTPCLKLVAEDFGAHLQVVGRAPHYQFTGPMVDITNIIAQHLGFCYEFVTPSDRGFGGQLTNGSWNGVIGMLNRSEVAMSGVILSVSQQRSQAVEFSEPLYLDETTICYKLPALAPDLAGFIKPFTYKLWLLVLLTCLVVSSATHLILHTYSSPPPYSRRQHPSWRQVSGWSCSLDKASLWTLSVLMYQSVPWKPAEDGVRVITGVWLVAALIVGTVYRSNLQAMLTIPKLALPFTNLEELVHSNIPTAVSDSSMLHFALLNAERNSSLGRLSKQMVVYPLTRQWQAIVHTEQGLIAGAGSRIGLNSLMTLSFSKTGRCSMYLMSHGFLGPTPLSLAFPRGSALRPRVDEVIRRLRESGLLDLLTTNNNKANATECLKLRAFTVTSADLRPLSIGDFYGVFSVYVAGLVVAIVLFMLERLLPPLHTQASP